MEWKWRSGLLPTKSKAWLLSLTIDWKREKVTFETPSQCLPSGFFEPTSKLLWSSTSLKLSVNATWASFRKSVWNEFRMVTFPFENRNLIVNHWDEFVCIYLHNPKNHFDYIGTNLCTVYSYINVKSFINALLAISFICIIKGWRFLRESLCNQIT